ncbi:MAG: hypothetical protein JWQ45_452 [Blastococcus sp.]|nr:hypothetical protein [Blastococcus sp.]
MQPVGSPSIHQGGHGCVRNDPRALDTGEQMRITVQLQGDLDGPPGLGDGTHGRPLPSHPTHRGQAARDRQTGQETEQQGGCRAAAVGDGCGADRHQPQPGEHDRRQVGRCQVDDPDRPRHRHQPQVHPRPARGPTGTVGQRSGTAHTVTSSASSVAIAGPIPGTSSSWATLAKGPSAVR